jgi:hypothetical protein
MREHDYPYIETDPLGAIGRELVLAAGRQTSARRRRKHASVLLAVALGLLATAAGALAVTNTGTGVPAIDRYLDAAETATQPAVGTSPVHDHSPMPLDGSPPPQPSHNPVDGSTSVPFSLPLSNGTSVEAVSFENRDGSLCTAFANPAPRNEEPDGMASCIAPTLLAHALEQAPARVVGLGSAQSFAAVQGFTSKDVTQLTVIGPEGPTPAVLSREWNPPGWTSTPIRAFAAPLRTNRENPAAIGEIRLKAELSDGTTLEVEP